MHSPMPRVEEMVEKIREVWYITTLDMTKGYWQIPIAPEDQEKTAFGTSWGLFEFQHMPFRSHGSAATFQCLVDKILNPYQNYVGVYVDNIIIFSSTWKQHLVDLKVVLGAGLIANPQKCWQGQRETKYLGLMVGQGRVQPIMDMVEAL